MATSNFYFSHYLNTLQKKYAPLVAFQNNETEPHTLGPKWRQVTYHELISFSAQLAQDLINKYDIQNQDGIAILSDSCPEWIPHFYATQMAAGIFLPMDTKLTVNESLEILEVVKPKIIFISKMYWQKGTELKKQLSYRPLIVEMSTIPKSSSDPTTYVVPTFKSKNLSDTALIAFTSGSTGKSKGAMITLKNLFFQMETLGPMINLGPSSIFASLLPLNHLFELTCGHLTPLHSGSSIIYPQSLLPQEVLSAIQEKSATTMITIPLFLRMVKNGILKEIQKQSKFKQTIFHFLCKRIAPSLPMKWRRKVFAPIIAKFGNSFQTFISGGAPLESETKEFFNHIGIQVLEGYGLSETSPVITLNTGANSQIINNRSVGQPIPGVKVKISPQCEILTQGPHVMKGYFQDEALTKQVIDENGWFHTGDLGNLDANNYLTITGRSKNIIVLGGGKNVSMEEVEQYFQQSPYINESCIVSRPWESGPLKGSEQVCVVIRPSDLLKNKFSSSPHLNQNELLKRELQKEIDRLTIHLSSYKRPTKLIVIDQELPKTTTRKIKRQELNFLLNAIENNMKDKEHHA